MHECTCRKLLHPELQSYSKIGSRQLSLHFIYVEHSSMVISKVVFEGTVNNVDRGISNASHTSSNGLSCSCVVCEHTICEVYAEVVEVINIQHTTIRG